MTNSFGVQVPYQNMDAQMYQQQVNPQVSNQMYQNNVYSYPQNYGYMRQPSLLGGTVKAATVGFLGGSAVTAGIDYFKNRRPVRNGETTESFAKKVLDRIIEKDYVEKGKNFFKQKIDVLKNIDAAKTPEKFRKLMKKNREFCKTLCDGISLDTMCDTVTKENLKEKISAIKQRTQASLKTELQNIKDTVKLCWDSDKKKFAKPDCVDNKLFKIIKDTSTSVDWKKACKYGGITAGVLGALTLVPAILSRKTPEGQG